MVKAIKKVMAGYSEPCTGDLWAYRVEGVQVLSFTVFSGEAVVHDMTFTHYGRFDVEELMENENEICVPDLVEALHLAGIILRSLDIPFQLPPAWNEQNEACLGKPLKPEQTNGRIKLFTED